MRKNFFKKKLASTLALAMVVTSLAMPTNASAATATKIVKQGGAAAPTVLYVGEKGTDYGLSKVVKGNKYTWTTSNSKIATINKSGVVTAKAPGKVTIKVTARDSKGKWLKAFTQKLTINQRATSIDIGADDFKLVIGQDKDLNAVKTPAKSTDVVKYVSDNTAVATVNAKTGVVKAVGVGEATITVLSKATSASADTSKYNKKDTVKVTVADGIQSIKQTTPTKFEVTFATDQSQKLTTNDLTVTDPNGVKQIIKSLGFSTDGKTVTAEVYVELSDSVVYKVAYGTTEKTFTASKGEVASVAVEGKTVQYATATNFTVKLLDKNGVDVTTPTLLSDVSFDYDSTLGYIGFNDDSTKYQLTAYNFPKSISVTAVYHTYKYADNAETVFKGSAVFNSVEEIKDTASSILYTIAPETEGPKWTEVKTTLPATAERYRIYIKAENSNGDAIDETNFDFESTDTSIITVSDDGLIYPVKAGTAYIKATYGATQKLLAVTVGAESKVATVTPDTNNVVLYYVDAPTPYWVDPSVSVKLTANDQYGSELPVAGDQADPVISTQPNGSTRPFTIVGSGKNVVIDTDDAIGPDSKSSGTYTYKVSYKDRTAIVNVKVVKVAAADATPTYFNFDTTTATLDSVITSYTSSPTSKTLKVYGYNNKAQKVKVMSDITFSVKLDGKTVTPDGSNVNVTTDQPNGSITVTALNLSGGVATQAAVGTYSITARSAAITNRTASASVVVKSTQSVPSVKLDKASISVGGTVLQAVADAFDVSVGTIVDAEVVRGNVTVPSTDSTISGQSLLIKKVVVEQTIGSYTLRQEVSVGQYLKIVD